MEERARPGNSTPASSLRSEDLPPTAGGPRTGVRLSEMSPEERRALLGRLLLEKAAVTPIRRPLSYGQKALWVLHRLDPACAAYTLSFAAHVRGELSVAALARTLQTLVDRHESLRTTFVASGGMPYQEVHPRAEAHLEVEDASAWSWEEVRRRCEREVRQPFDLERGPLLRSFVYRRSDEDAFLLLMAHHLVGDFWSLVQILEELGLVYRAQREGRPASLPALRAGYGDFVRWQEGMLSGPDGERLEAYWREALGDRPPELNLPADHPRPPAQTFTAGQHAFRAPEALTRRLKALASEEGATLFMVLLAAYEVLLSRHGGQDEFLVGWPVAGRTRTEFRSVVGFFVNMLVERADLQGNPTFRTLLRRVRTKVLGALEHQDYPFARLVERLAPLRDRARAPFLQATLVLQKNHTERGAGRPVFAIGRPGARVAVGDLALESLGIDGGATQFDLTLFLEEDADGSLLSTLVYHHALFEAATIERMAARMLAVLQAAAARADDRVHELPVLAEEERRLLQVWSQGHGLEVPRRFVHEAIAAQAARTPWSVAVRCDGQTLTYAELNRRANRVAHVLRGCGLRPDGLVGLRLERSLELVVSILAVLKAGGAYLPLDPSGPLERLDFIMTDSGAGILLEAGPAHAWSRGCASVRLDVREIWTQGGGAQAPAFDLDDENLAYVLYTSGSTGRPKGVGIPHRALRNHMAWMGRCFPLNASDRVLQKTSFTFDASVWEFLAPLMDGAELVVARPGGHEDVSYLIRVMAEEGVTTLQVVPSLLEALLEDAGFLALSALRRVFCGGESLPLALVDRFRAISCAALVNLYGPTEACIDATFWSPGAKTESVRIGRPIANVQCYVLDEHRQILPVDVPGELYIGGAGVGRGYLHRPDLTAERFVPHVEASMAGARLYRTGDRVRWRSDGALEFLGRFDRQVNVRGLRVEPEEIEQVLSRHPRVRQAAVVCDDRAGASRLVAYVVGPETDPPATDDLRDFANRHLPRYMVPSTFVRLEALPTAASGKVDYRALPPAPLAPGGGPLAPRNATEQMIADIWAAVLGKDAIGVHDNFFDLGGDSLGGLRVVSLAQGAGLPLSLEALLRFQTVAELAEALAREGPRPPTSGTRGVATRGSVLVPLQPLGSAPPLFCIHPVEGSVHGFASLVKLLGENQPLYGIQAPELGDEQGQVLPARVEDLATAYIEALRSVRGRGPYHLLGASMGAAVAYEIGRQLQQDRHAVAFLGMLDQGARPDHRSGRVGDRRLPVLLAGLASVLDDLDACDDPDVTRLLQHPRVSETLSAYPDPARARRFLEVTLRNARSLRDYAPPVTALRVWLFRASVSRKDGDDPLRDPDMGWAELARGGVAVAFVPGDHFTMLRPPHVSVLAERLKAALRAASHGSSELATGVAGP